MAGNISLKRKQGPLSKLFARRERDKSQQMIEQSHQSAWPRTRMLGQRMRGRAIGGFQGAAKRILQGKRDSRPD